MKRSAYAIFICITIVSNMIISHPPDLQTSIAIRMYVQELERRACAHLQSAQEHKDIYQVFAMLTIQGQLQTCIDLRVAENTERLQSIIVHLRTESENVTDEIMQTIGETTHQAGIKHAIEIMHEIASRRPS